MDLTKYMNFVVFISNNYNTLKHNNFDVEILKNSIRIKNKEGFIDIKNENGNAELSNMNGSKSHIFLEAMSVLN